MFWAMRKKLAGCNTYGCDGHKSFLDLPGSKENAGSHILQH